jgi:hypothetical protein
MRLEAGKDILALRADIAVYLNDKRQALVVIADEEKGYIKKFETDAKGKVVQPGRHIELYGRVRIIFWYDQLTKVR